MKKKLFKSIAILCVAALTPSLSFAQGNSLNVFNLYSIEKLSENIDHLKNIPNEPENSFLNEKNNSVNDINFENARRIAIRSAVIQKYGEPDYIIDGKDIQRKEKSWSSGLYHVLLHNFQDKIQVTRDFRGRLHARAIGSFKRQRTFILVDGIVVPAQDYMFVGIIPPSEVLSVEVIEQIKIKTYPDLHFKTFLKIARRPRVANIIAIYTKDGQGLLQYDHEIVEKE